MIRGRVRFALALAALALAGGRRPLVAEEAGAAPPGLAAAVERGLAYLRTCQNPDGSWGSAAPTLFDIYAPLPGSQQSFQVASSALALSALVDVAGDRAEFHEPIRRGARWLVERHAVRRVSPDTLYNIWAHAYGLAGLCRLIAWETDPDLSRRLREAAQRAVDALHRQEFVEGGWGYYNFDFKGHRPGEGATSFTTATVLVALAQARAAGLKVSRPGVDRALRLLRRCEYGADAFAYSYSTVYWGTAGINKVKGSLARTPACLEAYRAWDQEVAPARVAGALEQLERYGHFLILARKYPVPHETWYQNSGYFCHYGYYYAGRLLARVADPAARRRFAAQLAARLVPLQEKDGSWYDYQLFHFHKAYGTGYALLTLGAAQRALGV